MHNSRCTATHTKSPDDTSSAEGKLPNRLAPRLSQRKAVDLLRCTGADVTITQPPELIGCVLTRSYTSPLPRPAPIKKTKKKAKSTNPSNVKVTLLTVD